MGEYGPHCTLPAGTICGNKNCTGCKWAKSNAPPVSAQDAVGEIFSDGCRHLGHPGPFVNGKCKACAADAAAGEIADLRAQLAAVTKERNKNAIEASSLRHELHEYKATAAACMAGRDAAVARAERAEAERDAAEFKVNDAIAARDVARGCSDDLQARVVELSADHLRFGTAELPCSKELADNARVFHAEMTKRLDAAQAEVARLRELAKRGPMHARLLAQDERIAHLVGLLQDVDNGMDCNFEWRGERIDGVLVTRELMKRITAAIDGKEGPPRFYLLSLKHTKGSDGHLTWWRPDSRGYCWSLTHAGLYDEAEAKQTERASMHDGMRSCVAVPEAVAKAEAYYVVENNGGTLEKLGTSTKEWREAVHNG